MPGNVEFLSKLDPELAHNLVISILEKAQSSKLSLDLLERAYTELGARYASPNLYVEVGGVTFENPFILAAGFDKNGKAVKAAVKIGFSSVVVGTVTEFEQSGNTRPRIFRVNGDSLVNSMGFPNIGANKAADNLKKYQDRTYPIGVSIGINKDTGALNAAQSFATTVGILYDYFDFAEINVSSPNTEVNKKLQHEQNLRQIIFAVQEKMSILGDIKPLFLKVTPDATSLQIDTFVKVAMDFGMPIVATNTSAKIARELGFDKGGASGQLLRAQATAVINHIYRETNGKVEIIGVGGVSNIDSAMEKFEAGAKALQIYTGFVFPANPALPSQLCRELDERIANGR